MATMSISAATNPMDFWKPSFCNLFENSNLNHDVQAYSSTSSPFTQRTNMATTSISATTDPMDLWNPPFCNLFENLNHDAHPIKEADPLKSHAWMNNAEFWQMHELWKYVFSLYYYFLSFLWLGYHLFHCDLLSWFPIAPIATAVFAFVLYFDEVISLDGHIQFVRLFGWIVFATGLELADPTGLRETLVVVRDFVGWVFYVCYMLMMTAPVLLILTVTCWSLGKVIISIGSEWLK